MNVTRVTSIPESIRQIALDRLARYSEADGSGCIIWKPPADKSGYGRFRFRIDGRRRMTGAHRAAYLLFVGDIPDNLVIDHLCRNTLCVNPDHLEAVTAQVNTIRGAIVDRTLRTGRFGRKSASTCGRGHNLTGDNLHLYVNKDGYVVRVCITCRRNYSHAARARKRASRKLGAPVVSE